MGGFSTPRLSVNPIQKHPLTPSHDQVRIWWEQHSTSTRRTFTSAADFLADKVTEHVAQLAADQELDACCEWLSNGIRTAGCVNDLRDARRPEKRPLKVQALEAFHAVIHGSAQERDRQADVDIIRRALESMSEDQ